MIIPTILTVPAIIGLVAGIFARLNSDNRLWPLPVMVVCMMVLGCTMI